MTKEEKLVGYLRAMGKVAIAFSGGVDSSLLIAVAKEALGLDNVIAFTVNTPYMPAWEIDEATELARHLGVQHTTIDLPIADSVRSNPPNRCYVCKHIVFTTLLERAHAAGFDCLVDGTNADDIGDYRPGMQALKELGIRSPFLACGIGKQDIRVMSRARALPTWDKPPYACLLSRIPYGTPITEAELRKIEHAEKHLMNLGFRNVRVRSHGNIARIEVDPAEVKRLLDAQVAPALKSLGFVYVTLDVEGYRTGSLNETL